MVECAITRNIDRPCKDLQGGISSLYLLPYAKHSRSQIVIDDQSLISIPGSNLYEVYSSNTNFTETTEVDGGAVFWKQTFSIEIPKTEVGSQVYLMTKKYYRAIFQDNNGNWRILGLFNGLTASYTNSTGSGKSGFSGYSVNFEGQEDRQALYLQNFDPNPNVPNKFNFIFQDSDNYVFQDINNFIFN